MINWGNLYLCHIDPMRSAWQTADKVCPHVHNALHWVFYQLWFLNILELHDNECSYSWSVMVYRRVFVITSFEWVPGFLILDSDLFVRGYFELIVSC